MQLGSGKISFICPQNPKIEMLLNILPIKPFDERICSMLSEVSKEILKDIEAKAYPDVITFAFWCRRANIEAIKKRYNTSSRIGRGVLFHITPSNVPVNFAYSLVAGLLAGNLNIVRVPTKDFKQIEIIAKAFKKILENDEFNILSPYVVLLRYERDDEINEYLSSICDIRIIWGGDNAIREIRRAELNSRAYDVTFADRYSVCAIQAQEYNDAADPVRIAQDFYNDTYLLDQNACTAPHLLLWVGEETDVNKAKKRFWTELYRVVSDKYTLQPVQAVDKLTALYKCAVDSKVKIESMPDNLIVRVKLEELNSSLENYRCQGGFFLEHSIKNLDAIVPFINRKYQTLSYYGFDLEELTKIVERHSLFGIDRIVPIGKTMDFSLNWDGYDLINVLSRKIEIV